MKRFLLAVLLLFAFLGASAQRPKVGVVLCGGGAKAAAHIGVLKVLEENNIPIDYIAGTSMGAILGGLYAVGYSADELDSLILSQNWDFVMKDQMDRNEVDFEQKELSDKFLLRIPIGGKEGTRMLSKNPNMLDNIPLSIVKGNNVYNLLTKLTVGYQDSLDFNNLPIPFACVAVDLSNKKEYVFHQGNLVEAMRASMAIPGYFAPVRKGDMVLFDGGLLNNYPVDVVKQMGADIVIGVKLGGFNPQTKEINNIGDMANEMMDLYMDAKLAKSIENTDVLISPSVAGHSVLSFDIESLTELIENGRKAAEEQSEALQKLRDSLTRAEAEFTGPLQDPEKPYRKARCLGSKDTVTISSVQVSGLQMGDIRQLLRHSQFQPGARLSGEMIEDELEKLYSTGAFSSVTYSLSGEEEPYHMTLNFVSGPKSQIGLGMRFDTEEIAAILLNLGFNEKALYGHKVSLTAKLAYNLQVEARYNYAFRSVAHYEFGYKLRNSSMPLFEDGVRNNYNFMQHSLWTGFATHKTKLTKTTFGVKMDYFEADLAQNLFLSGYFHFALDRFDHDYFPTKGVKFNADYSYYFNKLIKKESKDFMAAHLRFSFVAPMGNRFALIGTIENRTLIGDEIPTPYMNIMGGTEAGRYIDQQMPFTGFNYTRGFKNCVTVANIDLRYRMMDHHYFFASGAWAQDAQVIDDIFEDKPLWGARLGYSYDSLLGPVSVNFNWSNVSKVGVYLSLGYSF